jgi:hypothetical protein
MKRNEERLASLTRNYRKYSMPESPKKSSTKKQAAAPVLSRKSIPRAKKKEVDYTDLNE